MSEARTAASGAETRGRRLTPAQSSELCRAQRWVALACFPLPAIACDPLHRRAPLPLPPAISLLIVSRSPVTRVRILRFRIGSAPALALHPSQPLMTESDKRESSKSNTWRQKHDGADTSRANRPAREAVDWTPAPTGNWRPSSASTTDNQRAESKEEADEAESTPSADSEQENRGLLSPPLLESRPADRMEAAGIEAATDIARPLPVKSAVTVLRRVEWSSPSLAAGARSISTQGQMQTEQKQPHPDLSVSRPAVSAPVVSPPSVVESARAIYVDEVRLQRPGFESSTLLVCPLPPLLTAQTLGALFLPYGSVRVNIVLSGLQGLAAVLQFESISEARAAFIAMDQMALQIEVERANDNQQNLRADEVMTHTLQLHFVAPAAGGSGRPDVRCAHTITAKLVRTQQD